MATGRGRGRPKKTRPGQEWLYGPLPAHLQGGEEERREARNELLEGWEVSRHALLEQYGGFGIPDQLAYELNDAHDPELSVELREKILAAYRRAQEKVNDGQRKGGLSKKTVAETKRVPQLDEHAEWIHRLRTRGLSENAVATKLAAATKMSLSTAKRWLKKK